MGKTVTCRGCDASFELPKKRGRPRLWCTSGCAQMFAVTGERLAGEYRDRAGAVKKCAGCAAVIPAYGRGSGPRVWCSAACMSAFQRRGSVPLETGYKGRVVVPARADGTCAGCPADVPAGRTYCSEACGTAFRTTGNRRDTPHPCGPVERPCDCCGRVYLARSVLGRYCGATCRNRATVNGRRRRLAAVDARQYSRVAIFERDDWVCRLCAQPVDRLAIWPANRAATIDHIVPISRGGADAPANLQTAHWSCNRFKGTKV